MEKVVKLDTDAEVTKRIERYIANPPENSRVFTITSTIAKHLLNLNKLNRTKKPTKISKYADDMAAGRWFLTGDTIKFSDVGFLSDGQNRLIACIRAGVSFQTHIVFGISEEAFIYLDRGRTRTSGDALRVAGFKNTNNLSAAVRWAFLIEELDSNRRVRRSNVLEPSDTLALLRERYAHLEESLAPARAVHHVFGHPIGQLAALHYHFAKKDRAKADEFFDAWAMGQHKGKYKSLHHLQTRVTQIKASGHGRIHESVRAAMVVNAWNSFRAKRQGSMRAVNYELDQPFPIVA